MPFYRYVCESCDFSKKKLIDSSKARTHTEACPECGKALVFRFGAPNAQAMETKDEYRGKSIEMGVSDKILERSSEHFRTHELPRLIEQHGREWAERNGHIDFEGNPVKK